MGNINKKEKVLLTVLIGACLAFLYIQIYLPKQTVKIDALKSNINDYESKIDSLNITSVLNIKLRKDLDGLESKYKDTIAAFPKEGRVPEIAYNLDVYTKENGITLSNIAMGDSQEFSQDKANNQNNGNNNTDNNANTKQATNSAFKLFIIPTNLSVSGEYLKVNSFLSTLEKDKRLSKIESLSLISNGPGKVTASLTTNYYYVPGLVISTEYPFNDGIKNKEDMFKE